MKTLPSLLIALSIISYHSESASTKFITARDGKKMVLIPGGTFRMGSEKGYHEESPVHSVKVASFYMDQQLVTNHEFKVFCDSTKTSYPADPRWEEMPNYFLGYPEPRCKCQSGSGFSVCVVGRETNSDRGRMGIRRERRFGAAALSLGQCGTRCLPGKICRP